MDGLFSLHLFIFSQLSCDHKLILYQDKMRGQK